MSTSKLLLVYVAFLVLLFVVVHLPKNSNPA